MIIFVVAKFFALDIALVEVLLLVEEAAIFFDIFLVRLRLFVAFLLII